MNKNNINIQELRNIAGAATQHWVIRHIEDSTTWYFDGYEIDEDGGMKLVTEMDLDGREDDAKFWEVFTPEKCLELLSMLDGIYHNLENAEDVLRNGGAMEDYMRRTLSIFHPMARERFENDWKDGNSSRYD